jgi:hypothetical protein
LGARIVRLMDMVGVDETKIRRELINAWISCSGLTWGNSQTCSQIVDNTIAIVGGCSGVMSYHE